MVNGTIELVNNKCKLVIAADDSLLQQLSNGNWIGGCNPYMLGEDEGKYTKEQLFVKDFSDLAVNTKFVTYHESINHVYSLPLVADYAGAKINIGFIKDEKNKVVYLPKDWCYDPERCDKAWIPEQLPPDASDYLLPPDMKIPGKDTPPMVVVPPS